MSLNIIVLAKQVIDPEMPLSAFQIDQESREIVTPSTIPPVVNGFDENAVEAALRIKDTQEASVTVISMGQNFALDVMKKPLSMGADRLVLLQDESFYNTMDSFVVAKVLSKGISKLGSFDLIIGGRQASDWDNAQVPLVLAELLGLPCISLGKKVEVNNDKVTVERQMLDGVEVLEAPLPTLVTVSNELGQPRYPTLRGIMGASRKQPIVWSAEDIGLNADELQQQIQICNLYLPTSDKECEIIRGTDDADSGRLLALKLREAKLI
jgi:electron transfer flavoprotein beta subunit